MKKTSLSGQVGLKMKVWDNVVVGAGISGLILAHRLKKAGQEVLVLDKAKSVGGRMATRRDGDAAFDHGAQYSSSDFKELFQSEFWSSWFQSAHSVKYSYKAGLNKAAKDLSSGLQVMCDHKVVQIKNGGVLTLDIEGAAVPVLTRRLYLTCPVPQARDLMLASQIIYPEELEQIFYAKALVGLFRVESDIQALHDFKYVEDEGRGIFSVANQKSKSVSESLAFTVVMNSKFSENYFNLPDAEILFLIENCFESFLRNVLKLNEKDYILIRSQVKKWRYSHPLTIYKDLYCQIPGQPIVLLGDGFAGPSLINAARSAQAAPI